MLKFLTSTLNVILKYCCLSSHLSTSLKAESRHAFTLPPCWYHFWTTYLTSPLPKDWNNKTSVSVSLFGLNFFFFFLHLLEGADSLSLLCLELVDSEFKLRVLGIEESSLQSCSMSSGTTGQGCLRLCLTASQLWSFRMSHPCLVLAIRPST